METDAINEAQHVEMPRTILAGAVDSQSPARAPTAHFAHANSTQSCRPREALLSSGLLCPKNGTPCLGKRKHWAFRDETVADRFGSGCHGAMRGGMHNAVAAGAGRRRHSGGAGRPVGTVRSSAQFCSAE